MAVNRWPIEKKHVFTFFPPIFVFSNLQSKKGRSFLHRRAFARICSWKEIAKSSIQYQRTIVFHVIINNKPPPLVSQQTFSPQITHTMCHKAWQSPPCDICRQTEREKKEWRRSVKEECSIMYSGFVQVTVGLNAAVTHLKLALACPQSRKEALQALANPYSPDTCSAWRILRYWPSIQPVFRVDEKR